MGHFSRNKMKRGYSMGKTKSKIKKKKRRLQEKAIANGTQNSKK
ncbi:hypothetical protein M222_0724 [Enterococcus faecalis AZ19]|nr:hypothetical protein M222_0724 [Enterococcus faecalis AZ19]